MCNALIGLHAFTGYTSVSAFAGSGKLKGLKLMQQNQNFQKALIALREHWHVTNELFDALQEFTYNIYMQPE